MTETIIYCGGCTLPLEYCEYTANKDDCMAWLKQTHPILFAQRYGDIELSEGVKNMAVQDAALQAKTEQAPAQEAKDDKKKEKKKSKIQLKVTKRSGTKHVTSIMNLELYIDNDLKSIAKLLAKHLSCGVSTGKSVSYPDKDEIIVQGDMADPITEMLANKFKISPSNVDISRK